MIQDNNIYIYIYIFSQLAQSHKSKKQLHVSALLLCHRQVVQGL